MKVKKTYRHGGYHPGGDRPRKKGVSQQERKDYAEMKAEKERERLRRRAEKKGVRAESRGEEPIGYRETIQAGGPRGLEEAVRGRTPIYQDEYDMLMRAAEVDPLDYYETVGLSGVRQGGEFADPCKGGNKGAGAKIACDSGLAKKLAKRREGKKTTMLDVLMSRIRGRMMPSRQTEAQRRYNPYNEEERARIAREMGGPTRNIALSNSRPSGFNIIYE